MEVGRPSEYREEYIAKVDEYLLVYADQLNQAIPTKEGFARYIGSTKRTILTWAEKHKDFLHALEKLSDLQAIELQNNALVGKYNPTIAKLMLSSNHGMKERVDNTTNDKDLPTPILANALPSDNSHEEDSQPNQEN